MRKKQTVILIALLFVAVLSVCIFVSLRENRATVDNQSSTAVSSSAGKSLSSAVLNSADSAINSSKTGNIDAPLQQFSVGFDLEGFKNGNENYQFFDIASSNYPFVDIMPTETVVSAYCDKKQPVPILLFMSKYGINMIDLTNQSSGFLFAEGGKITITKSNEICVSILDTKTKEIYDCKATNQNKDENKTPAFTCVRTKRTTKK